MIMSFFPFASTALATAGTAFWEARLHHYVGEAHKILQSGLDRFMLQAIDESLSRCRIMVAYCNQICVYHASIYRFCNLGPNGTAPNKPDS